MNNGTLIIITVILLGIFTVLILEPNKKNNSGEIETSLSEISNGTDEGFDEFVEEIQDDLGDNTNASNQ